MSAITLLALVSLLQGNVQLNQTVTLKSPSDGYRLDALPPARDFRIEVVVKCEKPGVVLDSVGINAAPAGSYSMSIGADRKVNFQVWQPGWTVLTSSKPLSANDERIIVERKGERVTLAVAGTTTVGTIKAPLSRDPLWIGDFPGDDSWGKNYNIHPAMVGTVRVVALAPLMATSELVVDETGTVSSGLKARMTKALEGINAQTGGRLYVLFTTAQNLDDTLAAAVRLREAMQAAHPNTPIGVLSYSSSGRGYSRTNSFDAKLNFEQAKAAWAATEGSVLADRVAQQLEMLAGQKTQTQTPTPAASVIGEAKIGPAGGKISSLTGDFEVAIPSGALAETQAVKVTQLQGGSYGRIVHIEAGGKLLAKPATITYRLPEGVDASAVVAAGHVTESLWAVHASQFNPATRTLTAKTNHFSNQGWFGMNKKQHQVAGAVTYSLTGTILIHVSTTALLGSAAVVSAPIVAVVAVFAAVGWFAGGTEYETLMKQGFKGPIPADGFSVYWKPDQVTAKGEAVVLVNKKTNKILTWVKDTDQWAPTGQGGTFTIELPAGEQVSLEDIGSYKVPTAVVNLATDLATTKRWYDTNRFITPKTTPVLVTSDVDKLPTGEKSAGEFEGTFLKVNGDLLSSATESSKVVKATVAHEYLHVVAKHNGFKEQFLGAEEAVAVAIESLVWPGANDGMTMNGWNLAGAVLQNGLKGTGKGEGYNPPDRRGYLLWSFPKYVYHQHGSEDFKALATGTMRADLLEQLFRSYVRSLTNREEGLDKEVDSEDGRGKIATGWPVPITELAQSTSQNNLPAGKVDVPATPALAVRTLTVKLPAGSPSPIVVRRRIPIPGEEILVLRPKGSASAAVGSDDRSRDEVLTDYGVVATPREWDTGELMLPVLLSSIKATEGTANPLYVYRLTPPPNLESVGASDGFHLKWSLPALNGVPPGDALWGYWIYGRLPGGEVRLVQELRFRSDQSPGGLSGQGGSRNAVAIPVAATEYVLPNAVGGLFEAFGMASVELVAKDGDVPLVSDIQWAGAPSDDLLKELQKSTNMIVSIAGVTEVKTDDNPNMKSGVTNHLKISTWGYPNTVEGILGVAKSYGKPVAEPKLTWSGTTFSYTLDVGPHEMKSTSRNGTSVSHATRNLVIRGQYDPKRRMVTGVTATFKSHDTTDFTPDPNWKPRSTVEALMGGPKASKTLDRKSFSMTFDAVPYAQSVKDQNGNTWIQFSLKSNTSIAGCYGDYEMEFTMTDKPSQKKVHRVTAGPPTIGIAIYPPEISVVFVIVK